MESDARRTEADRIIEDLKCVCADEFSRAELALIGNLEDSEFVSQGQLEWLQGIQTRLLDRIL
jgi:hypothetical protein